MIKEKDLQRTILDYLKVNHIFHYRNNSGAFKSEKGGFYHFGSPGAPDIVAVIAGRYVGIEVKGTKGVQNKNQKEFQKNLEKVEGTYLLVHSFEEFEDYLRAICYDLAK